MAVDRIRVSPNPGRFSHGTVRAAGRRAVDVACRTATRGDRNEEYPGCFPHRNSVGPKCDVRAIESTRMGSIVRPRRRFLRARNLAIVPPSRISRLRTPGGTRMRKLALGAVA